MQLHVDVALNLEHIEAGAGLDELCLEACRSACLERLREERVVEADAGALEADVTHRVSDGDAAWSAIQGRTSPLLVMLDRMMPGIDGLELCRRAQSCGAYPPVYIVMVTSAGEPGDVAAGLGAGADDYIPKPFNTAELRARANVGLRMLALQ